MKNSLSNLQDVPVRINVLGVGISALTLSKAVQKISTWIDQGVRHYINVCTVHTIMECQRNSELRDIVNKSGMAVPDGMPLVWLAHYSGFKETTRIYGPDLMLALCNYSVSRGYKHFFYGGNDGAAQELSDVLSRRYPGLQIVGAYSPPFRDVGSLEDKLVIEDINDLHPDIVWVGLGTPKQDYWVANHRKLLNTPVIIAVGAAFDFHTGRIKQAPEWMQRSGLEWLFRLAMEPRRLTHRYLVYNPLFIMHVLLQLIGIKRYEFLE